MDRVLLLDAAKLLDDRVSVGPTFALPQAVRQFNALLEKAKLLYPARADILAMQEYPDVGTVRSAEFNDVVTRLRTALELRRPNSVLDLITAIALPEDASSSLNAELEEWKEAVALGLNRTALLLAGSIAEALLLLRHPDTSERGPGLARLVAEARDQRLFGRDTLRQLETLNDYRDLIHTRAGPRNRIVANDSRVQHAAMGLKMLCSELEDSEVRF